jgi:glutathione synthase/RimK-type ligase-like ATP-grasp enzyme
MKLAIHKREGSFSDRWIPYCEKNNIPFKTVNCYDSDIISQIKDCNGLMWHWDLNDYKAALFARQLTVSIEKMGIKVFPDLNTGWHYEDKLGQKYLMEAIDAPLVRSYAFYSKKDALDWAEKTSFPKVFKLRTGASSSNVKLVKDKHKAERLIKKAFQSGFPHTSSVERLMDRIYKLKRNKDLKSLKLFFGGLARLIIPTEIEQYSHREKGYIYFQDFIPFNTYDTRLIVVGDRCYGYRRFTRKEDFRASGSGNYSFDPKLTDKRMIETAFTIAEKLQTQSMAFDFINDNDNPVITEISYCFCMGQNSADECQGNWDRKLNWNEETTKPQIYMIENFVKLLMTSNG